jgi:hypothetical protein
MRRGAFSLLAVLAALSLTSVGAGDDATGKAGKAEYDFGDKILYVVTKPLDGKGEPDAGLYEKVTVVRLSERSFVVGYTPDYGDEFPQFKESAGKRVWTPLSEILQMTEFKDLAEARKFFEDSQKKKD